MRGRDIIFVVVECVYEWVVGWWVVRFVRVQVQVVDSSCGGKKNKNRLRLRNGDHSVDLVGLLRRGLEDVCALDLAANLEVMLH